MNDFYGENPEAAKTFDAVANAQMPGIETAYGSQRHWGNPAMNRTAATAMYNDEDGLATNFERKPYAAAKWRQDATNDDHWGLPEPHTPLGQRQESDASVKNAYI